MSLIPPGLRAAMADRPADPLLPKDQAVSGQDWLHRLPRLAADQFNRWELTPDGDALPSNRALVLPVRRGSAPAVLKVAWPRADARQEHLALNAWAGRGAVRLLAADPSSWCLLLERLDPAAPLASVDMLDSCQAIGELMRTLDRPAPAQLDSLAERSGRWQAELADGSQLVPRRLTQQARHVLEDLAAGAPALRLVHGDLDDAGVLAPLEPGRGHWLAIAPKPVAGEWAYAVAPTVWSRPELTAAAHSLRAHVRLRADVVAHAAGLEPERVRAWTFVRLTLKAVGAARSPASDHIRARMIALAKAFAD